MKCGVYKIGGIMIKIAKKMLAGIIVCITIISSVNYQGIFFKSSAKENREQLNNESTQKQIFSDSKDISSIKADFEKTDIPDDLLEEVDIDLNKVKDIDDVDNLELSSFTTIKKDNTKTLYIFDAPVKYYDKKHNEVKFIDNSFKKSKKRLNKNETYELENASNSIKLYVPKKNNDSILVENEEQLSLKFRPVYKKISDVTVEELEFLGETETGAEYKNVFGKGYHLQYVPQNTGIKENIIIEKNRHKYFFNFIIETDTLVPELLEGKTINFVKKDTEEVVFSLGELFIKDSYVGESNSADHISFDNYYRMKYIDDGKYQLTYVLDKNFLDSKDTKYPVLVDPSIAPISSISDAAVYSSKPTSNFGSNAWIQIGNVGGSYGTGYGFFKTKAIKNYTYINPKKIKSASLRVYEGSGTTYTSTIKAYDTDDTWNASSITWKNKPGKNDPAIDSKTISSSGFYEFKITSLVKAWLGNEILEDGYEAAYGVMLVPSNSSQKCKKICSANYGTTSKRPTIKINYEEDTSISDDIYFIVNENSGLYLDANTSNNNVRQLDINYSDRQQWKVVKKTNGYYTIANQNYGAKGYLDADDCNDDNADIWEDGYDDWIRFKIVRNNDGTKTYRIMSKILDDLKALYTVSGSLRSGANVKFTSYKGQPKSQWRFIRVPDKYRKSDIKVAKIVISNTNAKNAISTYSATITNNYIKAAASTTTFEFIDSNNVVVHKVNVRTKSLEAGESVTVSTVWKPATDGIYQVRVIANATNSVKENDKSNNISTKSFSVGTGYRMNVNNYYDQAFDVRYSSCGNRATKIQELNNQVNKVFKEAFNLEITNNDPQKITSLPDECKLKRGLAINLNTIDSKCPGGTSHNPFCTGWTEIYDDFIKKYPGNDITTSVLWTGNRLYDSVGEIYNRSFSWYNSGINIQEIYEPSQYFIIIPSCLTHELSHSLGAPDHYHEILSDGSCRGGNLCKVCNPSSARTASCIMCDGWQDVVKKENKKELYCQGCYNDILAHLKSHH